MTEHADPTKPTVEDVAETLTGFDEIAIERMFREKWTSLEGSMFFRGLAFVLKRRDGAGDEDAFKAVMNAALSEVKDHFTLVQPVEGVEPGEA